MSIREGQDAAVNKEAAWNPVPVSSENRRE